MDPMDDDSMIDDAINGMIGDTEKETDKTIDPPEAGHTVTITISAGQPPKVETPAEDEPEDGGYSDLMKGLPPQ